MVFKYSRIFGIILIGGALLNVLAGRVQKAGISIAMPEALLAGAESIAKVRCDLRKKLRLL